MSPIIMRDVQTDLILPDLKAANSRQLFLTLANEVAIRTSMPADIVFEELTTKEQKSPSGIGDGVECRVRMELDLRHVGDDAEFGGLGSADDGDLVSAHGA